MTQVYAIVSGETASLPWVKVGVSGSSDTRKTELQTGNPYPLDVHCYIECPDRSSAFTLESELQSLIGKLLPRSHISTEWFQNTRGNHFVVYLFHYVACYTRVPLFVKNPAGGYDQYGYSMCTEVGRDIVKLIGDIGLTLAIKGPIAGVDYLIGISDREYALHTVKTLFPREYAYYQYFADFEFDSH